MEKKWWFYYKGLLCIISTDRPITSWLANSFWNDHSFLKWKTLKAGRRIWAASQMWVFFLSLCLKAPGSWSWRTARVGCSRSWGSAWPWKVNGEGHENAQTGVSSPGNRTSICLLRPPEKREGAGGGEADPERDVGGGGAAWRPGGPPGGAEAEGEGGGQGPGGRDALKGLQPQLGLKPNRFRGKRLQLFFRTPTVSVCETAFPRQQGGEAASSWR